MGLFLMMSNRCCILVNLVEEEFVGLIFCLEDICIGQKKSQEWELHVKYETVTMTSNQENNKTSAPIQEFLRQYHQNNAKT